MFERINVMLSINRTESSINKLQKQLQAKPSQVLPDNDEKEPEGLRSLHGRQNREYSNTIHNPTEHNDKLPMSDMSHEQYTNTIYTRNITVHSACGVLHKHKQSIY